MHTEEGISEMEIKIWIAKANNAFSKNKMLLTRAVTLLLKKRIVKILVWTVLMYDAKMWNMKQDDVNQIENCEMWLWMNEKIQLDRQSNKCQSVGYRDRNAH